MTSSTLQYISEQANYCINEGSSKKLHFSATLKKVFTKLDNHIGARTMDQYEEFIQGTKRNRKPGGSSRNFAANSYVFTVTAWKSKPVETLIRPVIIILSGYLKSHCPFLLRTL
jgi:hypothetical protein